MPSEEQASPKPEDEASRKPDETGSGEETVQPAEQPESTPEPKESPSVEELQQQLAKYERDYKHAAAKIAEQGETLKDYQTRSQRYEEALRALSGQVQQQQDPVAAAKQRWIEAKASYDPEQEAQAQDAYFQALIAQNTQNVLSQTAQLNQLERSLERVQSEFGVKDPNVLGQQFERLTPAERLEATAVFNLYREGKLPEILTKQKEAAERKAREAERINALHGEGTGGRPPGGGFQEQTQQAASFDNFLAWNAHRQREWLKAGNVVLDHQGEVIEEPPLRQIQKAQ